jgi:hypothetical protein
MSICSVHRKRDKNCPACNASPRDLFPDWDQMVKEAKRAGIYKCECRFKYYKTTNNCPLCGRVRKSIPL